MATPPTRVSSHQQATSPYTSTGTSKTCTGVTFQVGDYLEIKASAEQHGTSANVTPTLSAGAATWTKYADQGAAGTNNSGAWSWVGVVTTAATNATVTLARPTGSNVQWGFSTTVIRGATGIGVRFEGNNGTASGAPGVTQTVQANSLLTCQSNDWNAVDGASRTWRTVNGSPISESSYYRSASTHTIYGGYVLDSGAGGSVTMGLTTPSTQRWVMSGFEFLGSTSGGTYVGNVSAGVPRATASIAGTTTAPAASGTLSAATPRATASLTGTTTVPTSTGTVSATVARLTSSTSGTVTAPGSTGTLSASAPIVTATIAGTTTPPTYSGNVSGSLPTATGNLAGTSSVPTYSGTITAAIPPTRSTIAGTTTTPAGSATLSGAIPRVTGSLSGAVTPPTWTGDLAGQLARTTATMLGTATGPVFVGTLDATAPTITGSLSGTSMAPAGSGTLAGTLPRLTSSLVGVFVADPTYVPPELEVGPAAPPRFTAAAARESTVTATSAPASLIAGPPRPPRYRRQP